MVDGTNNIHLKQMECKSLKMNYIVISSIELPQFSGSLVVRSLLNKQTVMVRSSAKYGIINCEGNNKKFVPDQNSLLNKRDDNTMKIKRIALSGSFTHVKSLESRFNH